MKNNTIKTSCFDTTTSNNDSIIVVEFASQTTRENKTNKIMLENYFPYSSFKY